MKLIFTFLLLLVLSNSAFADIIKSEKEVLIELYNATNGNEWNRPWDLNAPIETWEGVTVIDGHVVEIYLMNNNLDGTIPKEIGKLKHLRVLNLHHNELKGTVPESVGKLPRLTNLVLSINHLEGDVPSTLKALSTIENINITLNDFNN